MVQDEGLARLKRRWMTNAYVLSCNAQKKVDQERTPSPPFSRVGTKAEDAEEVNGSTNTTVEHDAGDTANCSCSRTLHNKGISLRQQLGIRGEKGPCWECMSCRVTWRRVLEVEMYCS